MLVFSRREDESFMVGDDIQVTYLGLDENGQVKLGIDAPDNVAVCRGEQSHVAEEQAQRLQAFRDSGTATVFNGESMEQFTEADLLALARLFTLRILALVQNPYLRRAIECAKYGDVEPLAMRPATSIGHLINMVRNHGLGSGA